MALDGQKRRKRVPKSSQTKTSSAGTDLREKKATVKDTEPRHTMAVNTDFGDSAIFTLSKNQLQSIVKAMKPVQKEDKYRFEIGTDGDITVSVDEQGFILCIKLGTTDVQAEKPFVFYMDKSVLNRISSVVADEIKFDMTIETMNIQVGGTDINMGLSIEDVTPDISYTVTTKETKSSEWLLDVLNRIAVSKTSNAPLASVMYFGETIKYGSKKNTSLVKNGLSDIAVGLVPEFVTYLRNISTMGDNVDFIFDEEGGNFIVKNDTVFYKTKIVKNKFPVDIKTDLIDKLDAEANGTFSSSPILMSLDKLSIPLIGAENAEINMTFSEDDQNIGVTVFSIGNQASKDIWTSGALEGNASGVLDLYHLMSALSVMDDDVTISSYKSFVLLEDSQQYILLSKYL